MSLRPSWCHGRRRTMSQDELQGTLLQVSSQEDLWVICLCAQWCGICRQMQASLLQEQRFLPMVRWLWVDIEEHANLLGDLEVETFPTYLIGRRGEVLLYAPGPTQPAAIASYVMPYASDRVAASAVSGLVQQAFTAITLRFRTR